MSPIRQTLYGAVKSVKLTKWFSLFNKFNVILLHTFPLKLSYKRYVSIPLLKYIELRISNIAEMIIAEVIYIFFLKIHIKHAKIMHVKLNDIEAKKYALSFQKFIQNPSCHPTIIKVRIM